MTPLHTTFLSQQEEFEKKFSSLQAVKRDPDGRPITQDLKSFHKQSYLKLIEAVEEWAEENWSRSYQGKGKPLGVKMILVSNLLSLLQSQKTMIEKEI